MAEARAKTADILKNDKNGPARRLDGRSCEQAGRTNELLTLSLKPKTQQFLTLIA